jgi:DNA polymerase III, gamma/tau subunits
MSELATALFDEIKKGYLCHSYLLEGGSPAERLALAKNIASAILCEKKSIDGSPCFCCNACLKIKNNIHPDVSVRGLDIPDTGTFGIDKIRDVRSEAYILPNESDYKIYILVSAEKLTTQAQNALLKVFEEPPKNVVFILLAPFRTSLLPTVISRAKIYTLQSDSKNILSAELAEKHPEFSDVFSKRISGLMSALAKTNFSDTEYTLYREAFDLCELFFISPVECRLIEKLPRKREDMICFLDVLSLAVRDILLYKKGAGDNAFILVGENELNKASSRFSMKKLISLYDKFFECSVRLESFGNVNTMISELSFLTA